MSEMKKPVIIDTLGKLLDGGYAFNLWCVDCTRGGLLPIDPFVKKLGRDHSMSIKGHVKCGRCGGKNVEVRIQAPQAGERPFQTNERRFNAEADSRPAGPPQSSEGSPS